MGALYRQHLKHHFCCPNCCQNPTREIIVSFGRDIQREKKEENISNLVEWLHREASLRSRGRKCNSWRLSDCNERIRQKFIFLRHGPSKAWVLLENRALWIMGLIYNLILHVVSHSRSAPAEFSALFSCQS